MGFQIKIVNLANRRILDLVQKMENVNVNKNILIMMNQNVKNVIFHVWIVQVKKYNKKRFFSKLIENFFN